MIAFFEIPTNDFDKSVAFYQALFGEELEVLSLIHISEPTRPY